MCTGSTVAYWESGRATVACEHSNIIIMILSQNCCTVCRWSSSVGLVTKVQAGWSGAQILVGAGDFSCLQHVQSGSGAHPIPCLLAVKWLGLEADHFCWVLVLALSGLCLHSTHMHLWYVQGWLLRFCCAVRNLDSSVGTVFGLWMGWWWVWMSAGTRDFSG